MTLQQTDALDGAVAKAIRRLVPFLLLMYVLAFLDRANIGFAKAAFQADTGLSNAAYAFGAGVFFIGYGVARITAEFFREPDAYLGFLFQGATMGQLLCLPMIAFGLWLIRRANRAADAGA